MNVLRIRWPVGLLTTTICIALLAPGCNVAADLLPRTHTRAVAPDGRTVAFVRQSLNVDPPDDALFLQVSGTQPRRLAELAANVDWCRAIVWAHDSRRVGFLINDERIRVFDLKEDRWLGTTFLVKRDGYPATEEARNVRFSEDGTSILFERVRRALTRLAYGDGRFVVAPSTRFGSRGTRVRDEEVMGLEEVPLDPQPDRL